MYERIRSVLTYANVMATTAFFTGLGGGAYAAVALPPHSVGTKQLKNRAVTPAKMAPTTFALLKSQGGARGPQGPQGPQGVHGPQGIQGPLGPTGPSNGYFTQTFTTPVSLSVPGGDYVIHSQAFVENPGASSVEASCFLSANGTPLSAQNGANEVQIPPFPGSEEVSEEGVAHLGAAGSIKNTCQGGGKTFSDAITAIKVDTASP
jgi:hypothetical protein